jgi:hypothetical protein
MTDYGTIKLPRDEYEQHNDCRKDMNLTWSEYVNGEAPEISNNAEVIDETRLAEALADYLINGQNLPERVADELGGGRR